MKRFLSILFAVLILASLSVSAFAEGNVSKQESTTVAEVVSAVDADEADATAKLEITALSYDDDEDLISLIADFRTIFEESADLQTDAGELGVEIGSAFTVKGEGISFPVKAELKLEKSSSFVSLITLQDGKWVDLHSTVEDGVLSAELPGEGVYAIVARIAYGPSDDGNDFLVVEGESKFVGSVEVPGEPTLVKLDRVVDPEVGIVVITPFDEEYSMIEAERMLFTETVNDFINGFDQFVEEHPEYAGTAPSEAFFVSETNPAVKHLPAEATMEINDIDIFRALLFHTDNGWVELEATVTEDGLLSFKLPEVGTYLVLSTAA